MSDDTLLTDLEKIQAQLGAASIFIRCVMDAMGEEQPAPDAKINLLDLAQAVNDKIFTLGNQKKFLSRRYERLRHAVIAYLEADATLKNFLEAGAAHGPEDRACAAALEGLYKEVSDAFPDGPTFPL